MARFLGLQRRHWPALRRIVMGDGISLCVENEIRAGLDLPALLAPVLTQPCPDCGLPHTTQERCNGEPVEVVLLRPGQSIANGKRPARPEVQRMTDVLLQAAERAGIRDGDTIVIRGTR